MAKRTELDREIDLATKSKRVAHSQIKKLVATGTAYVWQAAKVIERDKVSEQWASDAADDTDIPKTKDEYRRALRAAFNAGVFFGIDECDLLGAAPTG